MVEEISKNLFRAEIPLPRNPLKYTNSYIIKSADRNLIIDTGLNMQECKDAMQTALDELGIDLARTDFFITHLHADHFGLVGSLAITTATAQLVVIRPPGGGALSQVMLIEPGHSLNQLVDSLMPLDPTHPDLDFLDRNHQYK